MPAVAIDIGTYTIKIVQGKQGKKPSLERIIETFNTAGVAVPADEVSFDKLQVLIDAVFTDNKLSRRDVRISLPETVVSTKVIEIPSLSDAELSSAIGWQAEKYIPIPPEELSLEYQVLFRPNKNDNAPMRVLLIGTRKKVVERYVELFNAIGIEPALIETQLLSVMRSLDFTVQDPTTLIVHLGSSSMDLALVAKSELQFVVSHINGGQLLSRTLEQTLALTIDQAEQYKRTYGLDPAQFQGKVRQALLPALSVLITEIRKTIQFYLAQHPQDPVQRIVLSGGTALLPGLVQHITSELGVETLVAAPFAQASGTVPSTINHPSFTVVMGLLMREL